MIVSAIYENGILRLLAPLPLPEHTRVQIDIKPLPSQVEVSEQRQRVREALVTAGLSLASSVSAPIQGLLSPTQRAELAKRLSGGRPLSEIIIEERESLLCF